MLRFDLNRQYLKIIFDTFYHMEKFCTVMYREGSRFLRADEHIGYLVSRPTHWRRALLKRILIADDHVLLREVAASLLRKNHDFEVDEASNLSEVTSKISETGTFDVILLDFAMPGMHGMDSVKQVADANKPGAVALFTGNFNKVLLQRALQVGARAYLPKTMKSDALAFAVMLVASGESYIPSEYYSCAEDDDILETLSEQQAAVLDGLCRGLRNKEIAQELNMTEANVKTQVRSVLSALGAQNRTQAVITASLSGWASI